MKTIQLLPRGGDGERELARMLELELADRGIPTQKAPSHDEAAALFLFAVVGPEETEALAAYTAKASGPVLCCAKEITVPLPPEVIVIERPFSVRRLCDSLRLTAENDTSEAQASPQAWPRTLTVDRVSRTVSCHGERVILTEREYALLEYLDRKRGEAVSREEAFREVWGTLGGDTNLVDVYIRHLRKKIDERFDTRYLITVRHRGYCLRKASKSDSADSR